MRSSTVAAALLATVLAACGTTAASDRAPQPSRPDGHDHPRHQGWPAPVEMHSFTSPRAPGSNRATTYGLGDVDGDGRPDLVQVRSDGRVTAELTLLGHRTARLPRDPTLRLQAFADLDGDGRAEVLVASTANGCCDGYRFTDFRSAVLVLDDERLQRLRWVTGAPVALSFDRGRGEAYAGIRCDGGTLHLLEAHGQDDTTRISDTSVQVSGSVARRGTTSTIAVPADRARAETRTRCPGTDAQGWAG